MKELFAFKSRPVNLLFVIALALISVNGDCFAAAKLVIKVAYITQSRVQPPQWLWFDEFVKEPGLAGAELAVSDNNTTGKFTGQQFELKKFIVPAEGNALDVFNKEINGKFQFVIVNLPSPALLQIADSAAEKPVLLFDAGTIDDALRNGQCRRNVLHMLPSRAMRADALAQYMTKKRWQKWFLVTGPNSEDNLFAEALKRSAKRLNMKLVAEKQWQHTYESRGTAQAEVPVFTQVDNYDVLVVADEQGEFGDYFQYRTWNPRPVIGTQGLIAAGWHQTHEQWGAIQIQNRFKDMAGRWMQEADYGAYLAARAVGEAATRTQSGDLVKIKDYLLSDQFALQGYKGNPLSFRTWDGQLRQPVLLAAARSIVAVAPIEGFLHPKTELDTLGYDQPETACNYEGKNETK